MLENLYFAKFTLTITAKDSISLPTYKGSTFRGGFGNAFKRIVCIVRNKDCETCLLKSRCIYVYIFETPPPQNTTVMRKYRTAPHPFVIEPIKDTKMVFTEKPEFHILIRNLLRRIAHLSYFHCGGDPLQFDFTGAISRATKIVAKEEKLQWYDWERYSARQDTRMKLGGFVGNIIFEGDLNEFIPYLKAGEFVHIGKGTSFGLGKYVMKRPFKIPSPLKGEG